MRDHILSNWYKLVNTYGPYDLLISLDSIESRIEELAKQINEDYKDVVSTDNPLIAICVLTGAVIFFSQLIKRLTVPVIPEYLDVSSYSGKRSSGIVKIDKDVDLNVADRHLLIVEDIIDSGLTLNYLLEFFRARNPASVKVCVLLDKEDCRKIQVKVDYVGFKVPDRFLVGYGLDYDEYLRNTPFVFAFRTD